MPNTMAKEKKHARPSPKRTIEILRLLGVAYPEARCALEHRNALELLIATILSAQCTDERVNIVTRELFAKYRTPQDFLHVSQQQLETDIRSTGFFRNKAKNIRGACQMLIDRFGGTVPESMEELVQLPGVARKTANVVLGVVFGKAEGIVVDTHVFRLSHRLDLSAAITPERVEEDLMRILPRDKWIWIAHQLIHHGRKSCKARKPLCISCPLETVCESADKTIVQPWKSGGNPPGLRAKSQS